MHDYLRAVGFSRIKSKKELNDILCLVEKEPDMDFITDEGVSYESARSISDEGCPVGMQSVPGEKSKYFAERIGITVRGDYDENGDFVRDYYFPFLKGQSVALCEEVTVEKHSDKDSYVGICDDPNVGVPLIFHLLNAVDYVEHLYYVKKDEALRQVELSAMSIHGKVVFPVMKSAEDIKKGKINVKNRNKKIEAARDGDQEAIESLTLEDLDLYTMVSSRARREDILSIVDTYFMPYGIACDQYSVLANIIDVEKVFNSLTEESVYILRVECNSLIFDICINAHDLLGEPEVGRRFKGNIWLQGNVDFQNMI